MDSNENQCNLVLRTHCWPTYSCFLIFILSPSSCYFFSDDTISTSVDEPIIKKKLEELHQFLAKNQHQFSSSAKIFVKIKIKIAIFKSMGDRPACINKVFRVIQSLPPTSVEAESFFSSWTFYYKILSTYQLTNFVFFFAKVLFEC